jgi:hypothetical protein
MLLLLPWWLAQPWLVTLDAHGRDDPGEAVVDVLMASVEVVDSLADRQRLRVARPRREVKAASLAARSLAAAVAFRQDEYAAQLVLFLVTAVLPPLAPVVSGH